MLSTRLGFALASLSKTNRVSKTVHQLLALPRWLPLPSMAIKASIRVVWMHQARGN